MNAKELFLKVKALFDAPAIVPPAVPVTPVAPAALATPTPTPFKLQDGTDITIAIADPTTTAAPSVGDAVTISGAPAPATDYTLEDGTVITVDNTGMISLVVMPQPATQPDFQEPAAKTLEERISAIESKITLPAAMSSEFSTMNDIIVQQKEEIETAKARLAKQDNVLAGMIEFFEAFQELPSTEPVTLSGNKKMQFERANNKKTRLEGIAAAMKERKILQ